MSYEIIMIFSYESMVANVESAHGQKLSDWNKKGKRIERQLTNIETEWQKISFLENSNEDQITEHRKQLEVCDVLLIGREYYLKVFKGS